MTVYIPPITYLEPILDMITVACERTNGRKILCGDLNTTINGPTERDCIITDILTQAGITKDMVMSKRMKSKYRNLNTWICFGGTRQRINNYRVTTKTEGWR